MAGNIRLWGTSGYVELAAPNTATNQVLTLPTDSVQPGMVLITTQSFSTASSVSVNNCFTSQYSNYKVFVEITSQSGNADIYMRMRSAGADNTASNYDWRAIAADNTGTSGTGGENLSYWPMFSGTTNPRRRMSIDIFSPAAAENTVATASITARNNGGFNYIANFSYFHTSSSSFDGFSILPQSSVTVGGIIRVFGYRNS